MNKYWLETSKETERAIALCYTEEEKEDKKYY